MEYRWSKRHGDALDETIAASGRNITGFAVECRVTRGQVHEWIRGARPNKSNYAAIVRLLPEMAQA